MLRKICLRELDTNGEEPRSKSEAHYFKRDRVQVSSPRPRIEDVGTVRPKDDAECGSEDDFVDIELR